MGKQNGDKTIRGFEIVVYFVAADECAHHETMYWQADKIEHAIFAVQSCLACCFSFREDIGSLFRMCAIQYCSIE